MFNKRAEYDLIRSYAGTSLMVILILMLFVGWWVNQTIQKQVVSNTASSVALYVESFIAPELQGLNQRDHLTEQEIQHLKDLLSNTPLGKKIRSVKVWKEDGYVVYHTQNEVIGQRFEPSENLQIAWQGRIAAELDNLGHTDGSEEDAAEAKLDLALLEIYAPIRLQDDKKIIAVVEFYQDAEALTKQLKTTRNNTWFVVIFSMLLAYCVLYSIVRHGNGIIKYQRQTLHQQVSQLTLLLDENRQLSQQIKTAMHNTSENSEKLLRRVSADLHDGPAQYLGFALLRLDALHYPDNCNTSEIIEELRNALSDSLSELRDISRGLALPDLEKLSLNEVISKAIDSHMQRTKSQVESSIELGASLPQTNTLLKITVFRAIQEALTNSTRHADGKGQKVKAVINKDELHLTISDQGPGFDYPAMFSSSDRLGLSGLRERIEALGGNLEIVSGSGIGTTMRINLPISGNN
ncbi:MAG: sensor histidine kinase [Neptuniibacter sp.]